MVKDDLYSAIDSLADNCCRLMTEIERNSFFEYAQQRSKEATYAAYNINYKTYYVSGQNKGKIKDVWEIDGVVFNQLWSHLVLYVTKAVKHSYGFVREDVIDDIEEIRLLLFKTLRYYGPVPCGQKLSKFIAVIVNNYLTNIYNSHRLRCSTKQDLKAFSMKKMYKRLVKDGYSTEYCMTELCSVYTEYTEDEITAMLNTYEHTYRELYLEELEMTNSNVMKRYKVSDNAFCNNDYYEMLFDTEIPVELQKTTELLIGGLSMTQTAGEVGIDRRKLKNEYVNFFEEG